VDLDVDLGGRFRGIVILAQVHRDRARAVLAARGHVVDAVRLRDGRLDRGGDESRDGFRVRARKAGGDRDDAVFRLRIGEHLQGAERAHPDHENDQTHHGGEHRTANEDVGELHGSTRPYSFGGVGLLSFAGSSVLSMTTAVPLRSFIWPAETTTSPSSMPLSIAT